MDAGNQVIQDALTALVHILLAIVDALTHATATMLEGCGVSEAPALFVAGIGLAWVVLALGCAVGVRRLAR